MKEHYTIFGISTFGLDFKLVDDKLPAEIDLIEFERVALLGNTSGKMYWKVVIASFLADDIKVYPLNGKANGIHTIGDIRKKVHNNFS